MARLLVRRRGRAEVFVTTFPKATGKWQVSSSGGTRPRWRHDGRELYFSTNDSAGTVTLFAATIAGSSDAFAVGTVTKLFTAPAAPSAIGSWDASADGQRFLVVATTIGVPATPSFTLLANWQALLKESSTGRATTAAGH